MKKPVLYLLFVTALFTSCATASLSKYRGVGLIKQYDFYSYDVPSAFDGFRIGFASDFHYESRFTRKRLDNAIRALQSLNADVLLLGGDYGSPKGGDMANNVKKRVKVPSSTPKRKQRMVCLMSEEELKIVDCYLKKYKITNKARWLRETVLTFIHQKMEEDYPTLFNEHDMRR